MRIKQLLIILLMVGISGTAQAQFLNKLKKAIVDKTSDAIINTASDKVAGKAADKTGKIVDGAFDVSSLEGLVGPLGGMKDVSSLPASYQFDHKYTLAIKAEGNTMEMDYYLSKKDPYFGASMNMEGASDIFMIFDEPNKAMVTVMGDTSMAMNMDTDVDLDGDYEDEYDLSDYNISKLPNKTFLGYDCEGALIESKETKMIVYFAPGIDNAFTNIAKHNKKGMPKGMDKFSNMMDGGLMMYMEVTDKTAKKKKNSGNAILECIAYEPTSKKVSIR